jgi:hypothetical protein
MPYAPVCLFTYNRLRETKRTIAALQKNRLASESKLIVFSDGPKSPEMLPELEEIREYLRSVDGFQSVEIYSSSSNKGLATSIIEGVTKVVNMYGKVIVLEDDLVTTRNFLIYMNQALDTYEKEEKIISISGYGLKIKKPVGYEGDVYLSQRASSWGWGTWSDRWNSLDWDIVDWSTFKHDKDAIDAFNRNGSDMFQMLKSVVEGKGKSWAIKFCYNQFRMGKYSITPFNSLVENIGFSSQGTNTKFTYSRFKTHLDTGEKRRFNMGKKISPNPRIQKSCYRYHSIPMRIYSRIRYMIGF